MKVYDIINEDGKIVPGVNTTVDVKPGETERQAKKFFGGNGKPKPLGVKGASPNQAFNLGLVEEAAIAFYENISHTAKRVRDTEKKRDVKIGSDEWFKLWFSLPYLKESALSEAYKMQLERADDMYILHILDTKTNQRTEVRGSKGYETSGYDSNDRLHKLLDVIGKSANISELMNGEVVTINPKHPDAERAKKATDVAFNEEAMKISDLTVSDAGMAIAHSAGGGSKTDAPITVTKLPSGHVYVVNGYHRLVDALNAGKDTIEVDYVPYEKVEILWKQEREEDIKYGKQFNESAGVGRVVKGVNTTVDVGPNEIIKQVKKYGNKVSKDGKPATMMTVNEALDQPYPVRWSVKNDNEWYGHAKEDDFYNQMGIEIKDGNDSGRWNIRFNVGDKMDKTGEGDQFKIFATVKAAIQEWWKWASKNSEVNQITFSAEKIVDSSRSKLYHRFAQQFARAIGYEMKVKPGRTADIFYIEKPNTKDQ